ncbi:MAG: pyruvate kinase, partial [Paracoccaceae bacterium]
MKRDRNVKIVATLGPASSSYEMIKELHLAGADVFRLNMSHGTHDDITERHRLIRQVEKEFNSPIGILADLQGPKLRVGVFGEGPVDLEEGASFRLDLEEAPGSAERVQLPHP